MPNNNYEHRPFSPAEAVRLRVQLLEATQDSGEDPDTTRRLGAQIDALNGKMTDKEIRQSWDEALEQFSATNIQDQELKDRYSRIDAPAAGPEVSDEAQDRIMRELGQAVDRLADSRGEQFKKEGDE